jgi:hypothetical protein
MFAKALARAALARGLSVEQAIDLHALYLKVSRLGQSSMAYRLRLGAILATDNRPGRVGA